MTKLKFFLCIALFTFAGAKAQQATGDVIGTPYLDDKYVEGVIYINNKAQKLSMRYNAYQDLIEYQQNGKALVFDPNPSIKKVELGSSTFVPLKYNAGGKSKLGYFALLDSGKVALYVKKSITFMPAKKGGRLDGTDQPAEYKRSADVFYFKVGDGELQEVGNIKSMIASLPDKQEELTQYAKKEKISPRKEKEVVQLVKYYNSL